MSWEAVTAISTFFTGLVILITVFLGLRQLTELRKATQLEGIMKIAEQLGTPEYQQALRFVRTELAARWEDPDFRSDWERGSVDPQKHPELHVLMVHELIGTYVKEGLIDGSTVYELCSTRLCASWERLKPVVLQVRATSGNSMAWENAELLSVLAAEWLAKQPQRR